MLHPSYTEIMKKVNANVEEGEEPVVNSRYSIVIAAAKRARQIIDTQKAKQTTEILKPLSTAVDEIYTGSVKILTDEEAAALEAEMAAAKEREEAMKAKAAEENAAAEQTEEDASVQEEANAGEEEMTEEITPEETEA